MDTTDKQQELIENIEDIYQVRTQSSMFLSKARWYDEGEKSLSYYLRLEKERYNARVITCLVKEDGTISRKQKDILTMQAKYYAKLYKSDPEIIFSFINHSRDKLLTEDEKAKTNEPLCLGELTNALNNMRGAKTPGCDGLPKEIFQSQWDGLGPLLFNALNHSFDTGRLFLIWQTRHYYPYPQESEGMLLFKNWRPLTLLNTDYKILSKVITYRMTPYLD